MNGWSVARVMRKDRRASEKDCHLLGRRPDKIFLSAICVLYLLRLGNPSLDPRVAVFREILVGGDGALDTLHESF
ncbi:MAG: hypothetical protein U1D30_24770 [Planctomycetota bacterium]